MSAITGDSRAALEAWLATLRLGGAGELERLPARRVDEWLTLTVEREAAEKQRNGD
ncbi:MAG: hypothetical protein R2748_23205 [Bryobacterales bacterium]